MDDSMIEATQALDVDEYEDTHDSVSHNEHVGYLLVPCQKGFPEKKFPIYEGENIVGRHEDCKISIPLKGLSREHACIEVHGDSHFIYDKGSRNRTRRNKHFLAAAVRYELKDKDELIFGDVTCQYKVGVQNEDDGDETGSETGSESMFQTAPADVDDDDVLSDASSGILEPTQPQNTGMQSMMSLSRRNDTTVNLTLDKTHEITVKETPAASRTKRFTDNLVLPESGSDTEEEKDEANLPTAFIAKDSQVSEDEEEEEEVGNETLLTAATQAYVCETDEDTGEEASDVDNSLLNSATQAFPANMGKVTPVKKTRRPQMIDSDDSTPDQSPVKQPPVKAGDIPETQMYDMDTDDEAASNTKSPVKRAPAEGTVPYTMAVDIPETQMYDMETDDDGASPDKSPVKRARVEGTVPYTMAVDIPETQMYDIETDDDDGASPVKAVSKSLMFAETQACGEGEEEEEEEFEETRDKDKHLQFEPTQAYTSTKESKKEEEADVESDSSEEFVLEGDTDTEGGEENEAAAEMMAEPTLAMDEGAADDMETQVMDDDQDRDLNNADTQVFEDNAKAEVGKDDPDVDETVAVNEDATQVFEPVTGVPSARINKIQCADTQVFDADSTQVFEDEVSEEKQINNKKGKVTIQLADTQVFESDSTQVFDDIDVKDTEGKKDIALSSMADTQVFDNESTQVFEDHHVSTAKSKGKNKASVAQVADTQVFEDDESGVSLATDELVGKTRTVDDSSEKKADRKEYGVAPYELETQAFDDSDNDISIKQQHIDLKDKDEIGKTVSETMKGDNDSTQVFDDESETFDVTAASTLAVSARDLEEYSDESDDQSVLQTKSDKQQMKDNCDETVAVSDETVSVDSGTVPVSEDTSDRKTTKATARGRTAVVNDETVALTDATVPVSDTVGVTDETVDISSIEGKTNTRKSKRATQQKIKVKCQSDETVPVADETVPVANDTVPVADETVPVADDTVPVADDTVPVADETIPVADETVPVTDETVPVSDETVPVADETVPVADETVPVADETVPVADETVQVADNEETGRKSRRGKAKKEVKKSDVTTVNAEDDQPKTAPRRGRRRNNEAESDTAVTKANKRKEVPDSEINEKSDSGREEETQKYAESDHGEEAETQVYADEDATPSLSELQSEEIVQPVVQIVVSPPVSPLKSVLASPEKKKQKSPSPKRVQFQSQKSESQPEETSSRSRRGRKSLQMEGNKHKDVKTEEEPVTRGGKRGKKVQKDVTDAVEADTNEMPNGTEEKPRGRARGRRSVVQTADSATSSLDSTKTSKKQVNVVIESGKIKGKQSSVISSETIEAKSETTRKSNRSNKKAVDSDVAVALDTDVTVDKDTSDQNETAVQAKSDEKNESKTTSRKRHTRNKLAMTETAQNEAEDAKEVVIKEDQLPEASHSRTKSRGKTGKGEGAQTNVDTGNGLSSSKNKPDTDDIASDQPQSKRTRGKAADVVDKADNDNKGTGQGKLSTGKENVGTAKECLVDNVKDAADSKNGGRRSKLTKGSDKDNKSNQEPDGSDNKDDQVSVRLGTKTKTSTRSRRTNVDETESEHDKPVSSGSHNLASKKVENEKGDIDNKSTRSKRRRGKDTEEETESKPVGKSKALTRNSASYLDKVSVKTEQLEIHERVASNNSAHTNADLSQKGRTSKRKAEHDTSTDTKPDINEAPPAEKRPRRGKKANDKDSEESVSSTSTDSKAEVNEAPSAEKRPRRNKKVNEKDLEESVSSKDLVSSVKMEKDLGKASEHEEKGMTRVSRGKERVLKRKESDSSSSAASQEADEGSTPAKRRKVKVKEERPTTPQPARKQPAIGTPKGAAENGLDTSLVNSPTLRKTTTEGHRAKVMFTGVTDEQGEKIVKELGGDLVTSVFECTHLVTDQIRRTVKFLCCLSRGIPIVSPQWLVSSKRSGFFADPSAFLVRDDVSEKKFKFTLKTSLLKASDRPLLTGYKIHVTKSVKPDSAQMKDIITCAGAQYLPSMPKSFGPETVVISCLEDRGLCEGARKVGISVVNSEFILTGVLRQEVLTATCSLFADEDKGRASMAGGDTTDSRRRKR